MNASDAVMVMRRYRRDPMAFVREWLGVSLWDKQEDILKALFHGPHRRVAVKSAHGVGKTFLAAVIAIVWLMLNPDSIVITTAPTRRQIKMLLWREIRRIWNACKAAGKPLGGYLPPEAPEMKLGDTWMAFGFSSDDPVNMLGFHSSGGILLIMDEASGIHPDIWEALHGVLVGSKDRLLAIANPTEGKGPFYELFKDSDCARFSISAFDTPNVREGRDVVPGMISRAWVADRAKAWGTESVMYRSRVLAEFPTGDDDQLIPLQWVDSCNAIADELFDNAAWNADNLIATPLPTWGGYATFGMDVARYGPDSSFIAKAYEQGLHSLYGYRKGDNMETAGWAATLLNDPLHADVTDIRVDEIGMPGVKDALFERFGERAIGMNGARSALNPERFYNARAEWLYGMRELMDPIRGKARIAVVRDDALALELTSTNIIRHRSGRILIESKDEVRKRIRRSPDRMDAAAYALAKLQHTHPGVAVDTEVGYRPNPWRV